MIMRESALRRTWAFFITSASFSQFADLPLRVVTLAAATHTAALPDSQHIWLACVNKPWSLNMSRTGARIRSGVNMMVNARCLGIVVDDLLQAIALRLDDPDFIVGHLEAFGIALRALQNRTPVKEKT
jgi:hypothetical protein